MQLHAEEAQILLRENSSIRLVPLSLFHILGFCFKSELIKCPAHVIRSLYSNEHAYHLMLILDVEDLTTKIHQLNTERPGCSRPAPLSTSPVPIPKTRKILWALSCAIDWLKI
jgi:hypothetical protein